MNIRKNPFSLRLTTEVKRFVKEEADRQCRSLNKQIEIFLKEKMNEYNKSEA